MGDMQIPERFGFHEWYKIKKGRAFPHGYTQMYRILAGKTDTSQDVIENIEALLVECEQDYYLRKYGE